MPVKKTILLFLLLILLPAFIFAHTHLVSDSICFKVPTFQCELDSMVNGNPFLSSFQKYESENKKILASLKSGMKLLDDSIIRNQICEMNSVVHVGYNDTVRQYIDLLIRKRPEAACALLGLSDHYVPMFKQIFAKYQLPLELAYLPSFASIYNPNSTSGNGATGYWKMTYLTGKLFNLEINSMVDERKDLLCSTDAAARYMKELYSLYNDWTLALTAFVSGPVNVNKAIRRANGKKDFWSLYPFLPLADRDYLPAFIAITYVAEYHGDYGLRPFILDLSMDLDTIHISRRLHFQQISNATGIPVQEIRNMNPQYKRDILPSQRKAYVLRLPANSALRFRQMSDSIFRYNVTEEAIIAKQNDLLFHATGPASSSLRSTQHNKPATYYTVRNGDNLGTISDKYHVTVNDVKAWNHLRSNTIVVGQKLLIHAPPTGRKEGTQN
jgi:membrane-bound lytic murein transglycosylase D